jgi:hypothetical protein
MTRRGSHSGDADGILIRMKALLLENIHPGATLVFKTAGFAVEEIPNTIRARFVYRPGKE